MLRYTGHSIADIGVATVTALARETEPGAITAAALDGVATYLRDLYVKEWLNPYISCVFPNSAYFQWYVQASQAKKKGKPPEISEKVRESLEKTLFAFRAPPQPEAVGWRCAFSGEPATHIVFRQHVPMLTGEDVLNFSPAGLGGLPIAAPYLVAIQAFPLGAIRAHGRALAVHSDDPEFTFRFACKALEHNRRLFELESMVEKMPDAKAPRSVVIHTLLEVLDELRDRKRGDERAPSVVVYHLTNSGQGPDIDRYNLPSVVVSFIHKATKAVYRPVWNRIERAAWERPKAKKGEEVPWGPTLTRNFLYEDLFGLPDNAAVFVRRYLLGQAWRGPREVLQPQAIEILAADHVPQALWNLTDLFLREILGMERERIETIRTVADRIAAFIEHGDHRSTFWEFYKETNPWKYRNNLIKNSRRALKDGTEPLITLDEYTRIFETDDGVTRVDFRLARDLLLIRLLEQLHVLGWFGTAPEVLSDFEAEEEEQETVTV